MSSVAIITARGGSKRIPRKNIRQFLGRPILAYTVEAAMKAGCFDEVMVSTDDEQIAETARRLGAEVPFMRSGRASDDHASTADAVREVLECYADAGQSFDFACCIYPAAPFNIPERLLSGYRLLSGSTADSVVPVVRFGYPIQRALRIEHGRLAMIMPENLTARSQDLEPAYHDAGQFYWLRVANFLRSGRLFAEHTLPLELPESEAQDIDTEEDWKVAELKYRLLQSSRGASTT